MQGKGHAGIFGTLDVVWGATWEACASMVD